MTPFLLVFLFLKRSTKEFGEAAKTYLQWSLLPDPCSKQLPPSGPYMPKYMNAPGLVAMYEYIVSFLVFDLAQACPNLPTVSDNFLISSSDIFSLLAKSKICFPVFMPFL